MRCDARQTATIGKMSFFERIWSQQPGRWATLFGLALCAAAFAGGCRKDQPAKVEEVKAVKPSLRVIAWGGAAGALEPCGCVADMLGGVDHAGAWVQAAEKDAERVLLLGAGPMFFMNPSLKKDEKRQALYKAEALADSLSDLQFKSWAPGQNDWALGQKELLRLARRSGAKPLAANLKGAIAEGLSATEVYEIAGTQVGIAGISLWGGPLGVSKTQSQAAFRALQKAAKTLKDKGAQLKIALVAAQRGEALRLAELVPDFQVVVVGKPADSGELNDEPIPALVIGQTLVVQGQNHIQGMSVVDLYVREQNYQFSDGTGFSLKEKRRSLENQIEELAKRLGASKAKLAPELLAQKEQELKLLRTQLSQLPADEAKPKESYFDYALVEVRESAGSAPQVAERLSAYYKRVNDYNEKAFADRLPAPLEEGQIGYVGEKMCVNCHQGASQFWKTTRHAHAYETLSKQHKQFNLDCVSCHVTGYDQPGGSTVTHVDGLTSVQCEACHGPGAAHLKNPFDDEHFIKKPPLTTCEKCHHQPHVGADWKASEALSGVIGPGHGEPLKAQ